MADSFDKLPLTNIDFISLPSLSLVKANYIIPMTVDFGFSKDQVSALSTAHGRVLVAKMFPNSVSSLLE